MMELNLQSIIGIIYLVVFLLDFFYGIYIVLVYWNFHFTDFLSLQTYILVCWKLCHFVTLSVFVPDHLVFGTCHKIIFVVFF